VKRETAERKAASEGFELYMKEAQKRIDEVEMMGKKAQESILNSVKKAAEYSEKAEK